MMAENNDNGSTLSTAICDGKMTMEDTDNGGAIPNTIHGSSS
jgi:hypothetical protein